MSAHVAARLSAFLDQELTEAEAAAGARARRRVRSLCATQPARPGGASTGRLRDLPAEAPAGYFDSFSARVRSRIETAPAARAEETSGPSASGFPRGRGRSRPRSCSGVLVPRLPVGWTCGRGACRARRRRRRRRRPGRPAPPAAAAPPRSARRPRTAPAAARGSARLGRHPDGEADARGPRQVPKRQRPPRRLAAAPGSTARRPSAKHRRLRGDAASRRRTTRPPGRDAAQARGRPRASRGKAAGLAWSEFRCRRRPPPRWPPPKRRLRDEARGRGGRGCRATCEKDNRQGEAGLAELQAASRRGAGRRTNRGSARRARRRGRWRSRAARARGRRSTAASSHGGPGPRSPRSARGLAARSLARHPEDPRADEARVAVVAARGGACAANGRRGRPGAGPEGRRRTTWPARTPPRRSAVRSAPRRPGAARPRSRSASLLCRKP